jgi:hypothetical protein
MPAKVSMPPAVQMHLMADIEFALQTSANSFLVDQKLRGNINPALERKFTHDWRARGRPMVVQFRYDIRTQYEFFICTIDTLNLRGTAAYDERSRLAFLNAWKYLGRAMSIKSYCVPDGELVMVLRNVKKCFEVLGANEETWNTYSFWNIRCMSHVGQH